MGLHRLVGELGAGQGAHALQRQVAQVGLAVLQELAQLVTGPHQQGGLTGRQGEETSPRGRGPTTLKDSVVAYNEDSKSPCES